MAKKRDGFWLGITVIVIFVLFFSVVVFIGAGWDREPKVPFVARFPHTLNLPLLEEGAEVIGFGQVIGKAKKLHHVEAPPPGNPSAPPTLYLEVEAEVNASVGLRQDCRIVAEGPVLGGKGNFRITHRGVSPDLIDPAKPVYGSAGGFAAAMDLLSAEIDESNPRSLLSEIKLQLDRDDVSSLVSKIHRSMDDLNALTRSVAAQMNPAEKDALIAKVSLILDNLNQLTSHLRDQVTPGKEGVALARVQQALNFLNSGLAEAVGMLKENRPHVSNALASIEHMSSTVDTKIADPIARELESSNPQGLLAKVHGSFEKLNRSLVDLNVVTDKGRKIVVLNEGLVNRLLADLKETSVHLKSAAKDLRCNPWRLLYRPSPEAEAQLNILDSARAFSEAAGRLDDSVTQLQALLADQSGGITSDDPELVTLRKQLLETFDRFRTVEQALWKQLDTP
ncbi:MAG: hypothetical protein KAV82_14200 [Phycisphaerae bacterium]|nr:hypothetical protein [Phycisphaerae bacterium]